MYAYLVPPRPVPEPGRVIVIRLQRLRSGEWVAEIGEDPGAWVYGRDRDEAARQGQLHALRWYHDRLASGAEPVSPSLRFAFVDAGPSWERIGPRAFGAAK